MSQIEDEINRWLKGIKGVTCYTEKMKVYAPTCNDKCLPAVEKKHVPILFRPYQREQANREGRESWEPNYKFSHL